jgi:outer membrane protein assembly factor BamB
VILGSAEVAFGQTIQYAVDISQGNIDWSHKTAVDEIPSRKRSASERDALAVDGGIYQHARTIENRTVSNGVGDAGGIKPSRPGLPVIETQ